MEYVSSLYVYVCKNVNVLAIRFNTVVANQSNRTVVLASESVSSCEWAQWQKW